MRITCIGNSLATSISILSNSLFSFYIYNWYRLVIGISFELGCSQTAKFVRVVNFTTPEHNETNINLAVKEGSESNNSDTNNTLGKYKKQMKIILGVGKQGVDKRIGE